MTDYTLKFQRTFGSLPTDEFWLLEDRRKVGLLQLRHSPSHSAGLPDDFANHIFYEIEQEQRNRGLGQKILQLGLLEARKINLKEVILVCDESNLASQKIIEKNGGKLVGKFLNPANKILVFKYLIKLF